MATRRETIREAKQGVHWISFQPLGEKKECTVVRVSKPFVWVLVDGKEVCLNQTASRLLLSGHYR